MVPLVLDLTGHLVVVIGGGPVGRRKAAGIIAGGARVRLVCLETRPAQETSPDLEWITASFQEAHLTGATLVFAAGPPELNRQIVALARTRNLWVNSASDPQSGTFVSPAVVRRGDLLLSVSTSGKAPVLTRAIQARLEKDFPEEFAIWVELISELRPWIMHFITEEGQRRELLERLTDMAWLDRLRKEGTEAVRAAMKSEVIR